MSLDTLWTQFQNAQLTICQLFKYKMPSELAFLSHNVVPQGLHPISSDTFKNGCNIICISIIFLSFNNNCKHRRPFLNVLSAEPFFTQYTINILIFVYKILCTWTKKKNQKKHYVYVVITVLNEVSLLCTEFSIQCHVLFFLTSNKAKKYV